MKTRKAFGLVLFLTFLTACAPSQTSVETAIAQTEAALPTQTRTPSPSATPTITPSPSLTASPTDEPTSTPEPSPTPVSLPETLYATFSDIRIIYRDDFDFLMEGLAPPGWESTEPSALKEIKENVLRIRGLENPGLVFYFSEEVINPGEGVYFAFKYRGAQDSFSLGFDNLRKTGERIPFGENGFRSVALNMVGTTLDASIVQNSYRGQGFFKGDIKLEEDTWYQVCLAYDEMGNYIIKAWRPEAPESPLVYMRNWPDFPRAYFFISWVSSTRTLWMDEFSIFKFSSITEE